MQDSIKDAEIKTALESTADSSFSESILKNIDQGGAARNYKIIVPATNKAKYDETKDTHEEKPDELEQIDSKVYYVTKDWTDQEELRVKRKADMIIMPLLVIGFFALQIDRGNISNALTGTLELDLKIDQNQVNVGNQLLYVGIVLGEIPSNYVLQKIGPRTWISLQIFVWGIISMCQAFIQNYAQFIATRILLGFAESGFICAGLFCLSCWYKKEELGIRHTFYYIGNYFSLCVSGYIAGGILKLGNVTSYAGWRWLFLIEGLFTLAVGLVFFLLFPQSTRSTSPIWNKNLQFFNERERHILTNRLLLDDPIKLIHLSEAMSLKDIVVGIKKWRPWFHGFISFLSLGSFAGLNTYYPTIIKSMGYTQFQLNAMSSVGYWIAAAGSIFFSLVIGKVKPYGLSLLFICLWQIVFLIAFRSIVGSASNSTKYLILTLLEGSYMVIHVINTYWVSVNSITQTDRAVALALNIMLVNMGNIYGNQILRSEDLPLYQKGLLLAILLFVFAFIAIILFMLQYYWKNKQLDKKYHYIPKEVATNEVEAIQEKEDENGFVVIDFTTEKGVNTDEIYNTFRYSP